MKREIAIGIAVYNPKVSILTRLEEMLNNHFSLFIYDNSPESAISKKIREKFVQDENKICYLTSGKNTGLGVALSALCAQAFYDSFLPYYFLIRILSSILKHLSI